MADDPALAVAGLSKAQQKTRANTLRTRQQGLDGKIKAAGGKVTGRYQYAYNGVRVQAKATKLAALAALPGRRRDPAPQDLHGRQRQRGSVRGRPVARGRTTA